MESTSSLSAEDAVLKHIIQDHQLPLLLLVETTPPLVFVYLCLCLFLCLCLCLYLCLYLCWMVAPRCRVACEAATTATGCIFMSLHPPLKPPRSPNHMDPHQNINAPKRQRIIHTKVQESPNTTTTSQNPPRISNHKRAHRDTDQECSSKY